jgi:hypothetical protein
MREVQRSSVYRHYKGNYYYVLGSAEHTETGEYLVIYHALYGEGDTYARPQERFLEEVPEEVPEEVVNPTGQKYRFELVDEIELER